MTARPTTRTCAALLLATAPLLAAPAALAATPAPTPAADGSHTLAVTGSPDPASHGSTVTWTYTIANPTGGAKRLYWGPGTSLTDTGCTAITSPSVSGRWVQDGDRWYVEDGTTASLTCSTPIPASATQAVASSATLTGLVAGDGTTDADVAAPTNATATVPLTDRFVCAPSTVLVARDAAPVPATGTTPAQPGGTTLSSLVQGPQSVTYAPLTSAQGWYFAAPAFDTPSGYVYAISTSGGDAAHPAGRLLRLTSTGVVTDLGAVDGLSTAADPGPALAGAIVGGTFHVVTGTATGGTLTSITLSTRAITTRPLVDTVDPGALKAGAARLAAVTAAGRHLWGVPTVTATGGYRLTRIDPATGEVDAVPVDAATAAALGAIPAAGFTPTSVWTYGNGNLGLVGPQGNVVQVAVADAAGRPTTRLVSTATGGTVASGATSCATPSDLAITTTAPATAARSGDPVTSTLTVTNVGATPSSGYVVDSVLPAGVTSTTPGCTVVAGDDGGRLRCLGGPLGPGQTATITMTATATATSTATSAATSTATSTATSAATATATSTAPATPTGARATVTLTNLDADPVPENNTTELALGATSAHVSLSTSGGTVARTSEGTFTSRYTVTVENTGTTAATYGPITDTPAFDRDAVVTGATWSGPTAGSATGAGPWQIGVAGTEIAPGGTHVYTVVVAFTRSSTGDVSACAGPGTGLHHQVSLPAGQTASAGADVSACNDPLPLVDLQSAVSPTQVAGSGTVTHTYVLTNPGLEALEEIRLTDATCRDPRLASPNAGDVDGDGLLDVTESWTYTCTRTLTYEPPAGGGTAITSVTSTADVVARGVGSLDPAEDSATATVQLAPAGTTFPGGPGGTGFTPTDGAGAGAAAGAGAGAAGLTGGTAFTSGSGTSAYAPATPGTYGTVLARTGAEVGPLLGLAGGLLAAGAGAVVIGRRRRR